MFKNFSVFIALKSNNEVFSYEKKKENNRKLF